MILREKNEQLQTASSADGVILREIVEKYSVNVYDNTSNLYSLLSNTGMRPSTRYQIILIIDCSNINNFLNNASSEISMVDINNIIHHASLKTGLKESVIIQLVTDLFYSVGIECRVEKGPVLKDNKVTLELHSMMPYKESEELLGIASKYITEADKKVEGLTILRRLAGAGVPKAFYYLGRFQQMEEKNEPLSLNSKAMGFYKIAADEGVPEAAVAMGDYYYNQFRIPCNDYTSAYYYYTRPGACAIDKEHQSILKDLYRQKKLNLSTLIMGGILLVCIVAFLGMFSAGIVSRSSRMASGIIFAILCAAVYGFSVYRFIRKNFDSLKWSIAAMYVLWSVYMLIWVLS